MEQPRENRVSGEQKQEDQPLDVSTAKTKYQCYVCVAPRTRSVSGSGHGPIGSGLTSPAHYRSHSGLGLSQPPPKAGHQGPGGAHWVSGVHQPGVQPLPAGGHWTDQTWLHPGGSHLQCDGRAELGHRVRPQASRDRPGQPGQPWVDVCPQPQPTAPWRWY